MEYVTGFRDWLVGEMESRGLSQAELARRAKVTRAAVNGVLSERRAPGADLCRAIARVLNVPEMEVFIRAGILTRPLEYDYETQRLIEKINQLPPHERKILSDILDVLGQSSKTPKDPGHNR